MITEVLLPLTVHGEPSGQYDGSSLDWNGLPVKAADYYGHQSLQTVFFNVTNFSGLIIIKATHDQNPNYDSTWAVVAEYGSLDDSQAITDYHPIQVYGNFSWLRATVENFTEGTIQAVTVVY